MNTNEISRWAVRLVVIDPKTGTIEFLPFRDFAKLFRNGDLVILNDAATLPASIRALTQSGDRIELRLLGPGERNTYSAVLFGDGDWSVRTEDRPPPPFLPRATRLRLDDQESFCRVKSLSPVSPRLVELEFEGTEDSMLHAFYSSGKPVQYAYRKTGLSLASVQTAYGARPWASEMPSAGRPLTWDILLQLKRNGVELASLTHAAGLSSTGDQAIDASLPLPEAYEIPSSTISAIHRARQNGGRVIAVGTSTMRALESATAARGLRPGRGLATLRIGPSYELRVVDGLLTGIHTPGESHYDLLGSLLTRPLLDKAMKVINEQGLTSHELGDSALVLPGLSRSTRRTSHPTMW